MCHPVELRTLTVGEMAAVQEFPRNWNFVGSPTDKCRQIGNAVPPRLGRIAGEVVLDLLKHAQEQGSAKSGHFPSTITHVRPHVRTRTYFKNGRAFAGDRCYYDEQSGATQLSLFDAAVDAE